VHCEEEVPVEVHSYVTAPLVFPKDPSYEGRTHPTHISLPGYSTSMYTVHVQHPHKHTGPSHSHTPRDRNINNQSSINKPSQNPAPCATRA